MNGPRYWPIACAPVIHARVRDTMEKVALYWQDGQFAEYGLLVHPGLHAIRKQSDRAGVTADVTYRRIGPQDDGAIRFNEDPTVLDPVRV